ncbi:serine protease inhibitor Kazal-type 1-like [Pleurodeles waltl]|uniref:serine protease inhibitor Kazal-type 1-like n=1 Tax=Pleurodeles waltl TaxID=8319 RepID=UPI00370996C3
MKVAWARLLLVAIIYCVTNQAKATSIDVEGREPLCYRSAACPYIYNPVCGTDNTVYTNECTLCVKNRLRHTDVRIKKMGLC